MQEVLRQHIEKIVHLSDEEFAFVLSHFSTQSFKKRDYIIQQGERVRYNYFVVSGLLKLGYTDNEGKDHVVSFAMEDWWETDYLAYHTQTQATQSLQCLEDTEMFCLLLEDYKKLCAGLQKMEHFFLAKANAGHIGSQRRIMSFLTSNAKERYEQLLERYPSLFQRVPRTLLASYLGVSRETLSRLSS
jgi:CRP-like cAMP-binding protein